MGRLYRRFINAHKFGVGSPARPAIYRGAGESGLRLDLDSMIASGYFVGLWMNARLNLDGYGSVYGVRGHAEVATGITLSGGNAFIIGAHGRVKITGDIDQSNTFVAGLLGQMLNGAAAVTELSHFCSAWLDNQNAQTITAGSTELLYMTNNAAIVLDHAIFIHGHGGGPGGGGIANFVEFEACQVDSFVTLVGASIAHGGTPANIKITIDGTDFWLIASTLGA